jgi:Holliday junction resolvase-like predicted endonuclease
MSDENQFTNIFHEIIEQFSEKLFLEFEYGEPSHYPIEFSSRLDVFNSDQTNPPKLIHVSSKKPQKSQYKFHSYELLHKKDNTFYYIPWDRHFANIFECVKELATQFNLSDIFPSFSWQQFELFIRDSLNHYGYHSIRTFRFKLGKKRHEVDIIARDRNTILFIDAKHWNAKTANSSALMKVAEEQIIRAQHLIKNPIASGDLLQKLCITKPKKFKSFLIYPIILVSSDISKTIILNGAPIISFIRFNEFLNNFTALSQNLKPIRLSKIIIQKKLD